MAECGFIGLGRMGANMVRRLKEGGNHRVVAYNRNTEKTRELAAEGVCEVAETLEELVKKLAAPRIIFIMLPEGQPVDDHIAALKPLISKGDILIDSGNSNWHDDERRAKELEPDGIEYMDCGTSGGIWGRTRGYCLMIGGKPENFKRVEPLFNTLGPNPGTDDKQKKGYLHCGAVGSGHFVKMVHNGIEYGMMQAYGEGYEILRASKFNLDLGKIAWLWQNGSVVTSWLNELAARAFDEDGVALEKIAGYVQDSGEGRWTIQAGIETNVPCPVITLSLFERFHSRQKESYCAKVVAALRKQFGGHAVKEAVHA